MDSTGNVSLQDKIRNLLNTTPDLDQVDIANRLNVDLPTVCKEMDTMVIEGKIKRSNNDKQ